MNQYLNIIMFSIVLIVLCICNKNKEKFGSEKNINEKTLNKINKEDSNEKESFGPACSSIYGKYNPRCVLNNKMYHVGYYNHKDQRYPILDMKKKGKTNRFILFDKKIKPFSQKYWDKVFYFKKPFPYEKNIPYSFIFNFFFVGRLINQYFDKNYYIFEKKMSTNLYKYVLFEHINGTLKYSFSLPDRNKITPGDTVFIRDKSSIAVYGPFTFIV